MPEFIANLRTNYVKPLIRPMANRCNQSSHMTYPHQHLKFEIPKKEPTFNRKCRLPSSTCWKSQQNPSTDDQWYPSPPRYSARAFWFGTCSTAATAALSRSPCAGAAAGAGSAGAGAGRAGRESGESGRLSFRHHGCFMKFLGKNENTEDVRSIYIVNCWKVWDNSG